MHHRSENLATPMFSDGFISHCYIVVETDRHLCIVALTTCMW